VDRLEGNYAGKILNVGLIDGMEVTKRTVEFYLAQPIELCVS
jgi:hypothetical protein